MKTKSLSKKNRNGKIFRFGTLTIAMLSVLLVPNSSKAQTIFSNPVGIGVGSVAAGEDLHVNGGIRFNDLATGAGTEMVTTDALGNLSFQPIPTTILPGALVGESLLWDGTIWQPNNFLRVNNFTTGPEIFEVGNTVAIDFIRTIHFGGNVGLDLLPGSLGSPGGIWMSHGWREIGNSLPAGENFMGTRTNWLDFAANIGMTDRVSGIEKDLNIQMQDFTVPIGDPLTNRIIFSGVSGTPPTIGVAEYATILGNGNVGIGLSNPLIKRQ
jgi:hypothetical protein